jgi:hypothetical protein
LEILLSAIESIEGMELELDWVSGLAQYFQEKPAGTIQRNLSNLRLLSLRSNYLGDEEVKIIAELLKTNESLEHLSLWDNSITDAAAVLLGEALRANRTLEYLSLGKNKISNVGGQYLLVSLTKYSLSPRELFERKKLIRELEKKKKETLGRKKRVSKSKSKKQQPPTDSLDKNQDTLNYDELINHLIPLEEINGGAGGAIAQGNRTLKHLDLSFNEITTESNILQTIEETKLSGHLKATLNVEGMLQMV